MSSPATLTSTTCPPAAFVRLTNQPWQDTSTPAWQAFARSWDDLALDAYMGDGGRYRQRRYGAFRLDARGLTRLPHKAHYQELAFNPLNGGIARWFEPMTAQSATATPLVQAALGLQTMLDTRSANTPALSWDVEAHQFRILATPDAEGQPTPEGLHRDGRHWVFIMLVARHNITGGETLIADNDARPLARFTLMQPGDALLLDDRRLRHATSSIRPSDPDRAGWRDALVLTFAPA
ncbi:2OG-Fe dioxygenase family protein [Parapedomonas caeni]